MHRARVQIPVGCFLLAATVFAGASCAGRRSSAPSADALSGREAPAALEALAVIDTSQFALAPSGFFGLDADLSAAPASFADPRFRRAVAAARPSTLAYPGGEIANFWDWKTGLAEREWIESVALGPVPALDFAAAMWQAARLNLLKGGAPFRDFLEFCRKTDAQAFCTVNVLRQSPDDVEVWALYARELGWPVRAWELGRGLFRPPYRPLLTNPAEYVERARSCAAALRAADPEAVCAACVPMSALGQTRGETDAQSNYARRWAESLAGEGVFDAVALETDAVPPIDRESDPARTAVALARFADGDLPDAIDRCARLFGNRPIWVVGCPLGGDPAHDAASPLAPLALGEIVVALGRKTPLVERALLLQAVEAAGPREASEAIRRIETDFARSGRVQNPRGRGVRFGRPSPLGLAARMAGNLFAETDRIVALDFYRPPRLSPRGRAIAAHEAAADDPPALAALALMGRDPRRVRVMAVNRSADPIALRIVIDRAKIDARVKGRVLPCRVGAVLPERNALSGAENDEVRVATRTWRKGRIELAPYSLAILDVAK